MSVKVIPHLLVLAIFIYVSPTVHCQSVNQSSVVRFHLYYSKNFKYLYKELDKNDPFSLATPLFHDGRPTKILCHGYLSSPFLDFPQELKNVYLNQIVHPNVILVDWRAFATIEYNITHMYLPAMGKAVAEIIKALVGAGRATIDDFHFIGHSLGAHIGGFIAPYLDKDQLLPRITGLDPAGQRVSGSYGLGPKSARFVDVVRTSAGIGNASQTVQTEPAGTVDFYVNGGLHQKACANFNSSLIENLCNHLMADKYYIESVTTIKGFVAYKCTSYEDFKGNCVKTEKAYMGEYVSQSVSGSYYLDTAGSPPFALG